MCEMLAYGTFWKINQQLKILLWFSRLPIFGQAFKQDVQLCSPFLSTVNTAISWRFFKNAAYENQNVSMLFSSWIITVTP